MFAVIRRYTGAAELIEELVQRSQEVEELLGNVAGFKAYYAMRSGDQLTSITLCEQQAGVEESTRRAAEWVKERLPGLSIGKPDVTEGEVFLAF